MPPRKTASPVAAAALAVAPKVPTAGPFTVAGQTMMLQLPERPHHRAALVTAFRASRHEPATVQLVIAAALGLCWVDGQRKDGAPAYHHRILDYGAAVLDWLLDAAAATGAEYLDTEAEITAAGNAGLNLVIGSILTAEDLEEAKGESRATEGSGSEKSSA